LYGLDKAKVEIRKKDSCILVEGYTDVIMANQAGTLNVVATSGTALTPYQLKILKRYTENLILGFDMDVAGDTATKRGIDLAQSMGFNIKVLRLPEGKDAAEIIAKNPKEWEQALSDPKSIMDFYFESAFKNRNEKSPEGKKEISKILLPVIKRIPNKIVQSYWVNELAKKLDVKEETIEEEMRKVKIEGLSDAFGLEPEEIANLPQKSRRELLEESLLTLIIKSPASFGVIEKKSISYCSPASQEILEKLEKKENPESDYFNYLCLRADAEEMEEKEIILEINNCLREIKEMEVRKSLEQLQKEIGKIEKEDPQGADELLRQFKEKSSELNNQ
jgi:DNA primase